jgi:hypothetical protein
MNNISQNGSD